MQIFLPSQKITIPKQYKKDKIVFSLINVGWIVTGILYIRNQINQLYLSNNEVSRHHIYVSDTHAEKLCFTKSSTRIN